MKLVLRAAGIIKSGPERELVDMYIARAKNTGRNIGFTDIVESELDTRSLKTRKDITKALLQTIQPTEKIIILDETGKSIRSQKIAKEMADWRDNGITRAHFLIGGADGFDHDILPKNALKWQLGAMTWPHKLVRVMMAEQIYRAISILAASPYHRE